MNSIPIAAPLRVLIVEDQPADAELIILRLRNEGFALNWRRVENELDYLAALETNPDLILSDWSLPQFSGLRALQLIRERGLDTPFIIVSGSIGEEAAIDALRQGAYDYILKDRPDRLGQAIQNLLDQKKLRAERKQAEEALVREQNLIHVLMDTVPDSIYFKDTQSRFIRINKAQARKLGFNDPEQGIGKTDFDFFDTEHAQAAYNDEQEIIRTGQALINIEELETSPGCLPEWVSTTKMPIRDQNGKIVGTFGISRNITEQKRVEYQLQESQRFSQATIDALTAHICVLDENGTILAFNQAWRDFADANPPIPPRYGLGSNYLKVCDSSMGPNSAEALFFAEGLRAIMHGEREQFTLEYPCNVPEGEKRWFNARVTRFSGEGPRRIVVAHINISERRLVEEALKESEERYRNLIEDSHELIFTHDLEFNILSMNPFMTNLLRIPSDMWKGLNLYNITPLDEYNEFVSYINTILQDGIASGQWRFLTKDIDECILEVQSTLIERQNQVPVVRCMAQNITEKVQREQELEATAAMGSALRSLTSNEEILPIILQEVDKWVTGDGSAISLLNWENGQTVVELSNSVWKTWTGASVSLSKGIFGQVFDTNAQVVDENALSREISDWPGPLGDIQSVACLPLISNNQLIGALWLGRKGTFRKGDLRVLMTVCDIAANAIRNATLYKEVKDRVATLSSLYDAGLALNSVLEPRALLEVLFKIAMDELHAERIVFFRQTPGNSYFKADLCLGFEEDLQAVIYKAQYPVDDIQTPIGWVQAYRLPLKILNTSGDIGASIGDPKVRSVLWMPINHGNNLRGILGVMSTAVNGFDQNQERLLGLFSNQAAVALENASLLSETRLQVQRLKSLHGIDESINAGLDLDLTTRAILEQIRLQLNVDAADILLFNPLTNNLRFINGFGFNSSAFQRPDLQPGQGLAGQIANGQKTVRVSNLSLQEDLLVESPFIRDENFKEYFGVPLYSKGKLKGLLELFHRSPLSPDETWLDFMETLAGQAAISIENIEMFENLQRSNNELKLAYDATIEGWSQAMDLRDKETEGHTRRVTEITLHLAKSLGFDEEALVQIRRGSLLHDIGKLGVPDHILLKPDSLTEEEWSEMKKHPVYAFQLLAPIEYLQPALDIPFYHHEKWDGSGYPQGLKGEEIPLSARIFSIVDVWDALTSNRPYRPAWTEEETINYLKQKAGKQFDPQVVNAFLIFYQSGGLR